jgi:hypothetical protein
LRTLHRCIAVYTTDEEKKLPDALPTIGRPSLLHKEYEIQLSLWCEYEASMQRSVAIHIVKAKAKEVSYYRICMCVCI